MGIMQHLRLVMPTARPARPWPSSGTWADGNGSGPALSSPGLAKPIENAQSCGLPIFVVFMLYLHLLTIK